MAPSRAKKEPASPTPPSDDATPKDASENSKIKRKSVPFPRYFSVSFYPLSPPSSPHSFFLSSSFPSLSLPKIRSVHAYSQFGPKFPCLYVPLAQLRMLLTLLLLNTGDNHRVRSFHPPSRPSLLTFIFRLRRLPGSQGEMCSGEP